LALVRCLLRFVAWTLRFALTSLSLSLSLSLSPSRPSLLLPSLFLHRCPCPTLRSSHLLIFSLAPSFCLVFILVHFFCYSSPRNQLVLILPPLVRRPTSCIQRPKFNRKIMEYNGQTGLVSRLHVR
jgi:hypothetical protein